MVRPPKNIQWWWSPQKPLKIYNGLFKTIEFYNGFLKKNGRRRKTTQAPVPGFAALNPLPAEQTKPRVILHAIIQQPPLNHSFKFKLNFSCQWKNFQCGQISVRWPEKEPWCGNWKWFGHCTWLSHEKKESSRVSSLTVAWKKTLTIPSLWKIDHRCALDSVFFGSFLQLFLLHQIFSQLDFMSLNWFCTQQLLHRFHKICKFSHYCRSCIVCTFLTKQTPSIFWYFYKVFNPT